MPITHPFVSGKSDPADATLIRPSNWNAGHTFSGLTLNTFNATDYNGGALTDVTIQAAVNACNSAGGGTVDCGDGTWLISTPIQLKSNVRIMGRGAGTIFQKNDGNGNTCIIEAAGTLGTTVALTGTPTYGSESITAATNPAALAAGSFVLIRDTQYTNTTFGRNQELNRVISVTGAGPYTFNLANRLIGTYLVGSSAEVLACTPIVNASIERLALLIPGRAPGTVIQHGGGLRFDLSYDCGATQVDCTGPYELPGATTNRSAHIDLEHFDIRDGQDNTNGAGYGYGVIIGESSQDVRVRFCYMENLRESDFTNNARDCSFEFNTVRNTQIHAIATHGLGGGRLVINGNIIHGCHDDAILVGQNVTASIDSNILISNNMLDDYSEAAILIGQATTGSIRGVLVIGNYFGACQGTGDGYMVEVSPLATQVTIIGNTFDNTNGATVNAALLINNNSSAANVVDVTVECNDFRNITGKGILIGKATRTVIRSNHFTNISSYNVDSNTLGGGVDTWVRDNTADDATVNPLAADTWQSNIWGNAGFERDSGVASKQDGNTIAHKLRATPTRYGVTATNALHTATVTAVGSGTITIGLKVSTSGAAVAVNENVAWWAEV